MKRNVVLLVVVILLAAFSMAGCGSPSTLAPTAVPVTPILVTETPPLPTLEPTMVPSPTPPPLPVACQPVELTKVTDERDLTKFKGITEFTNLGDSRPLSVGERGFTVFLSGAWLVIIETDSPTPIVLVSRGETVQKVIAFAEKQVYLVRATCISEGTKVVIGEVQFYYQGNEPYLLFP